MSSTPIPDSPETTDPRANDLQGNRTLRVLQRLRPMSAGCGKYLLLIALSVLITAITEPMMPALLQPLLDRGFVGNQLPIWMVPLFVLGVFALRGASSFVAKYATTAMSYLVIERLANAQFAVLHKAQPSLYTRHTASSLVNTLVHEVQMGSNLLAGSLLAMFKDITAVIALLAYLLYLNWQLTLLALTVGPLMAWVVRVLSRRLHRLTQQSQNTSDELAYVVEENVLAWRTVRLHHAEQQQQARFAHWVAQLRKLQVKSTAAMAAVMPATQMLAACALSAVICAALWQNANSGVSVGSFVAFITAMLMLVTPLRGLSEQMGVLTRGVAAIERGLDLLEGFPQEQGGQRLPEPSAKLDLHFENLSFAYPGAERSVLSNIELQIPAGRCLAFVGSSGSGKTTLVNLLPRFLDPSQGRITLAGIDLRDWPIEKLREQFSFVSQEVVMFEGSIASNVALGQTPDRLRVSAALEAAFLSEVVASLPQGMDTPVGHNANTLSGGQRQRLAIARALYKNAPIVVLDEATSALDNESEQSVKSALQRLTQGRTTLIIAHRLSTIEHADEIIVMQNGRIAEQGTHHALLNKAQAYSRLHQLSQQKPAQETAPHEPT